MKQTRPAAADPASSSSCQSKTEKILDAARRVFLEIGFTAATVDAIAAAAGVSKATIYTRFDSKQALFAAVIQKECRYSTGRIALAEDAPARDLESALKHIAETLLDVITDPDKLAILRLVIAEIPRFPELGPLYYEAGPAVTLTQLTAFLDRHRGELRTRDTAAAAQDFLSLLRGHLLVRALLGAGDLSKAARKRVADHAVTTFLGLYGRL
jgi:AcrR family transcriptional regulator